MSIWQITEVMIVWFVQRLGILMCCSWTKTKGSLSSFKCFLTFPVSLFVFTLSQLLKLKSYTSLFLHCSCITVIFVFLFSPHFFTRRCAAFTMLCSGVFTSLCILQKCFWLFWDHKATFKNDTDEECEASIDTKHVFWLTRTMTLYFYIHVHVCHFMLKLLFNWHCSVLESQAASAPEKYHQHFHCLHQRHWTGLH